MKKLKDIFYDLNDIMVALIIVAVAAVVILANINTILNYPAAVAEAADAPKGSTPTHYADNPPITNDIGSTGSDQKTTGAGVSDQNTGGNSPSTTGGGVSGQSGSGTETVVNYSIYVNPGSTGTQIADLCIKVGLFKDRQEFNSAVTAAGAEGKLKAGNFIIPSNATPAQVISILTR